MTIDSGKARTLGKAASEKKLRVDLERYCRLAYGSGASEAVIIPANSVTIDERVRLKCLAPRCLRAGRPRIVRLMCQSWT